MSPSATLVLLASTGWAGAAVAAGRLVRLRRGHARRLEATARACHELRGPLTAMRLGLGLAARASESVAVPVPVLVPTEALELELGRAELALEDLGHAAGTGRAERADERRVDRVDVGALLLAVAGAAGAAAAAAGVVVHAGWEGPVAEAHGDRLRIAQALANLVDNAIEHGGGTVTVHGRLVADAARCQILDGGPGLPASLPALVAAPRAGRGTRGRGLAIADAIARAHGGGLTVADGGGLVLVLPARARAHARA